MSLTEVAIKRPILFIVFYLILIGAGVLSYSRLKYELLPNIATPIVTVFTTYPGASPKEVENTVTKKIEESVSGLGSVKRVSGASAEAFSTVTVEFTDAADEKQVAQEVQRAISKVLPDLPIAVKSPAVEKLSVSDAPVLRVGVTANLPDEDLYALITNQLKPRLSQVKSVGRITVSGGNEREIKVLLDDKQLRHYELSILQVVEVLNRFNQDVPIGNIKDRDAELGIRLSGKITSVEQISAQVVSTRPDGSQVRLRDVARVSVNTKSATVINRTDRRPSVGLAIQKQSGSNAVEVAQQVRLTMQALEREYAPQQLRFAVAQDTSEFTIVAANAVYKDFFIALALVALVMLVFLHSLRNSLIVMLAIPTSLVTAFIAMYLLSYSLNLMTLLAMSLVIGILVDDSIVVLENIYRHLEMGKDTRTAALDGRNEIGFAALSITLVDVVVFLPMGLVPGVVGSMVREFSVVIVVSTLSSLLVSFTLTPMIASRFAQLEHLNARSFFGRIGLFFERQIEALTARYESLLSWSLTHKAATLGLSGVLTVGSFALVGMGYVGSEFAPSIDKGEFSLVVTMPAGTKLTETDRVVRSIEKKLAQLPEIKRTFTNVGYQNDGFFETISPNLGTVNVVAVPARERTKSLRQLGREIRRVALTEPGIKVRVSTIGLFGANDAPIQILAYGNNRDSVLKGANQLLEVLKLVNGTLAPRLSAQLGRPETEVDIDRKKLADLGLDIATVGATLRAAINGDEDMKFRDQNTEVAMRVVLRESDRAQTSQLADLSFINNQGQLVFLKQFATVRLVSGPSVVERRNRNSSALVLSQVVGRPVGDVGADIQARLASQRLPAGVQLSYEGDLELQGDSFGALGLALIISITLVYLIMVALYNNWVYPFVVLFSVPVALVGALLALALTAKSLNVFSIFGLIMLIGLVSKNAILLVDRANDVRAHGLALREALLDAGRTRLRPILMTTFAMVIGMLPLALAQGAGSEINSPLAWVLVGGLTSSMFLTLVLVPVVYYVVAQLMEKVSGDKNRPLDNQATPVLAADQALVVRAGLCLALLLASTGAIAQSQRLSLREAVTYGLANNPQVKIAKLEELKSGQKTREASSFLYPTVSLTAQYVRNFKPPVFFFPEFGANPQTGALTISDNLVPIEAGLPNVYSNVVNVSMPLFNREVYAGVRAAREGEKISEAQREVAQLQLAADIKRSYYNALLAQASQQLVRQSIARAELSLRESKGLLARGAASDADTLRAYVSVANLRPELSKLVNQVATAHTYLKGLLGLDVTQDISLTDSLTYQPDQLADFQRGYDAALENRPEMRQLVRAMRASDAQLKVERARFLPQLNVIGQYQIQSQAKNFAFNNYPWPQNYFAGLQLNIPLFAGFRTHARVQQATIGKQQAEQQTLHLRRQIATEVMLAHAAVEEARQRIAVQADVIAAAERSDAYTRGRYRSGLLRLSEVADTELALNQARTNYLRAVYDALTAENEYERALGRSMANSALTP